MGLIDKVRKSIELGVPETVIGNSPDEVVSFLMVLIHEIEAARERPGKASERVHEIIGLIVAGEIQLTRWLGQQDKMIEEILLKGIDAESIQTRH